MQKFIPALLLPTIALYWLAVSAQFFGTVNDERGQPLSGVELIFTSQDTTLIVHSETNGKYSVLAPKGTYSLQVSHFGYAPQTIKNITIGNRNRQRNIVLTLVPQQEPLIWKDEEETVRKSIEEAPPALEDSAPAIFVAPPPPPVPQLAYRTSTDTKAAKTTGRKEKKELLSEDKMRVMTPQSMPVTYAMPKPAEPGYNYQWNSGSKIVGDSIVPDMSPEQYNTIIENPFQKTKTNQFSTFSIDVDAASYSNVRRIINARTAVPPNAVRIEEMVNYFDYNYPQPTGNDPIRIVTELGKCPWNPEHHLLMVGLQGRDIPKERVPESNFVFLVDVSGSMEDNNKLPLVKASLLLLLEELRPKDRVALVTYAGSTSVVLESTLASEKAKITKAINALGAGGSTAGASGIKLAYQTARLRFNAQGNNRVVLCTDGDFNLGLSSEAELVKLIEEERKSGIYLTVLGFGTGNYQDGKMQELADHGNGNHAYIDQIGEAKKVLVKEFSGTLYTIAKDVKLQLVFNPEQVLEYRLIGYENRMLAKEDFENDAKDAGELGAGHTVTALYEIVPNPQGKAGDLVNLKFRYKSPSGNQKSLLVESSVPAVCTATPSDNFNFASAVAESGLLLRNSAFKGSAHWKNVVARAQLGLSNDKEGYRKEFVELMKRF